MVEKDPKIDISIDRKNGFDEEGKKSAVQAVWGGGVFVWNEKEGGGGTRFWRQGLREREEGRV